LTYARKEPMTEMDAKQHALTILSMARQNTERLLEDVPPEKLLHQPTEGANHALWVMGHLAVTDDMLAGFYDGRAKQLPEAYEKLFGMGSTPTGDRAAYPTPAEVGERMATVRKRFTDAVETADAAALAEPLPEGFEGFAPDKLGMLFSLAWHEGLHAGQLTMIRRSLGIGPKFG